jgi:dTMP kinase
MRGKFITFEGAEGSGKSTQIEKVFRYIKEERKKDVMILREPGGVAISEKIRDILLDVHNAEMCSEAETLLYMAARAQLTEQVLLPALKAGKIVLCDRFLDSTIVYQGYGNGVDLQLIEQIGKFATQNVQPQLTFLFDIDAKIGLARIQREKDRIENRAIDYHNRVRQGYLTIAQENPERIKVIEVNKSKEEIAEIVRAHVDDLMKWV